MILSMLKKKIKLVKRRKFFTKTEIGVRARGPFALIIRSSSARTFTLSFSFQSCLKVFERSLGRYFASLFTVLARLESISPSVVQSSPSFHHLLCWLCLYHDHLANNLPFAPRSIPSEVCTFRRASCQKVTRSDSQLDRAECVQSEVA